MHRVALIGAGRIGRIHAHNLRAHPEFDLRWIIDADAAAAERLAAGGSAHGSDAGGVFDDASIGAVVIASPTDTHAGLVERAAASGKAVFCEKPLDLDIERAERCLAAVARAGIPFYLGFNRRYDPGFARLKRESADLAGVVTVTITSRDPEPPPLEYVERSGGIFRDMMIHDFDMARWLLGEEPTEVFATGSCVLATGLEAADDVDTAVVILRTASGRICQILNSRRCAFGYDQRIEVFGRDGMLLAGNETATRVVRADARGFVCEPALPFFLERYRAAYAAEIADFARALAGESVELATGEDGLRALEIADAADRSWRTGLPSRLS